MEEGQNPDGRTVMKLAIVYLRRCDGLKSFLASRVPNLCLDCASRLQSDSLRGKLHSNRRVLILWQFVLNVSTQQVRLANSCITDENH